MFGARLQSVRRLQVGPVGAGAPYSAQAQAAFAAMTTQPSPALKRLYNNCINALIAAGIWTKLDALYLMNVETAQAARLNLKNPGTYNLTATSSPTFTAKSGYAGDGAAAYLNTNFNATTATTPNFVQDSATVFGWSLKQGQDNGGVVGLAGNGNIYALPRFTDDKAYGRLNTATEYTTAVISDGRGLLHVDRSASNASTIYRNGASAATSAAASEALANLNIAILRRNTSFFAGGVAMAGFGASLSSQNAADLYAALNTFKTGVDALP